MKLWTVKFCPYFTEQDDCIHCSSQTAGSSSCARTTVGACKHQAGGVTSLEHHVPLKLFVPHLGLVSLHITLKKKHARGSTSPVAMQGSASVWEEKDYIIPQPLGSWGTGPGSFSSTPGPEAQWPQHCQWGQGDGQRGAVCVPVCSQPLAISSPAVQELSLAWFRLPQGHHVGPSDWKGLFAGSLGILLS